MAIASDNNITLQCLLDEDGHYLFVSDTTACFLGCRPDELLGKHACCVVDEQDVQTLTDVLQSLEHNATVTLPCIKLLDKNRNYKFAEISLTNALHIDRCRGIFINYRNVSGIVKAKDFKEYLISTQAAFFDKHPFGVLHLTSQGRIDRINSQLSSDLGYSMPILNKQPVLDFLLPQYRRKAFLMYYNAIHRHEPETYDVEVYKIDGQPVHVNLTVVPVLFNHRTIETYVVVKDISERITLRESLRRNSIVADKSLNGIVIMDCTFKIEWVNKSFIELNGYTFEECIGEDPADLLGIRSTVPKVLEERVSVLAQGKSLKTELLCYKKDCTPYWNQVDIAPVIDRNGRLERIISTHTDITEKKRADDDLKSFAADLYKQNKELHQFAYIVSHNLRSPVASIMGLAKVLELYKDDKETLDTAIRDLSKAACNLDTVIKDLSTILEITNHNQGIVKEVINVKELVDQILLEFKPVIEAISATVTRPDMPVYLKTNKAYLYHILYNLTDNALKYHSHRRPVIEISYQCESGYIAFAVADNGIGINLKRHKDAIFKPYHRFTFQPEGKGLGLFLVKSHVEALGGSIQVESDLEGGTTFKFNIAIKTSDD